MPVQKLNIASLVNNDGCFDLQFRKDTRHERTNSPTYYRWKVQFVVTASKDSAKNLKKIESAIGCGDITLSKDQARFSVQKIDDIIGAVIPYFKKNTLSENKKKDFELWAKAVGIIKKNKGQPLSSWKKSDLLSLIQIQKSASKYKSHPRQLKWMEMAKTFANPDKMY